MPQAGLRRRIERTANKAWKDFLWVREISRVRFRDMEQTGEGTVSSMRLTVPAGEIHEEGRARPLLQRRDLRLQNFCRERRSGRSSDVLMSSISLDHLFSLTNE